MRFSWAKTPTMNEISRVNRGLMCPAVTTGAVVVGGGGAMVEAIVRHAGAIVRQGQRGVGGRADVPRRGAARVLRAPGRGWGVGRAVAGRMWAHAVSGRDKRGPPMSPRCRGRAISPRNNSARKIRSGPAREVPAPPSARDVQAGPAQGPAATSAALPCGRGAGDARFHVGTVPPGRYVAVRRAKYPRRPRRGTSKRARHRARHRARPRQARPSHVAEGVGDAGFHVGTVPK